MRIDVKNAADAANLLIKNRTKILNSWEAMVLARSQNDLKVAKVALKSSLPQFLDFLTKTIKQSPLKNQQSEGPLPSAPILSVILPDSHTLSVEQILTEFDFLRKIIFETLERESLLTNSIREVILEAVKAGVTETAHQIFVSSNLRDKLQLNIHRTERLFRAIFDFAALGMAIIDIESGNYLRVNHRFYELHGYTETEIISKSINDLTFTDDRKNQDEAFQRNLRSQIDSWTLEKRNVKKDGQIIWVLASNAILYNENGKASELITTLIDISAMKNAVEKLRKSEEYNRRIIESSEDCFKIISLDGTLLELAESSKRHLEIEEESSIIGTNWVNFWRRSNDHKAAAKAVDDAAKKGRGHFVGHYRTPSGKREWWDVIITPILDEDGNPEKLLVVTRDITPAYNTQMALKESEKKFRSFAESMPQSAFIADASGNIIYYNRRHYEYFGVSPGETESWAWKDKLLHHPDDLERTISTWTHAVESGEPYEIEYRLRRHDGQYRWHLGRAIPQRDDAGNVIRWFGTNTDIDDQKQSELEQKKLNSQLKAEKELRERFVNTLTHDLRTPLSVIKMSAQILEAESSDPDLSDIIQRILRNVSLSDQMIRDLLDTNRIRAGKGISIKIKECVFSDVVSSTIKNMEILYGPRFKLEFSDHLAGFWDPAGIRRITENLLTNAIKYGYPKSLIKISIKDLGDNVQLCIHNDGPTIKPEDQASLFEQFSRAKSAESGSQKGWGIGLTIVKGIADAHCAEVTVSSQPQEGTKFYVTFPRDSRTCSEQHSRNQEVNL